MCDVHLIPDKDENVKAKTSFICGECRKRVCIGEWCREIEGPLDDGSGVRYRYRAHEDCFLASQDDVQADGCFIYGGARKVE